MDKGILLLITLLISHKTVINAAPMSFRDSITSMSTISKSYSYLESSYAISPKDAFGINISENKGDTYKLKAGEFFYLRRLMRINKSDICQGYIKLNVHIVEDRIGIIQELTFCLVKERKFLLCIRWNLRL